MQTAMFEYADGTILEFGTRGEHTPDEGSVRIGNLFFGTKGWLWIEESGTRWQSYMGPRGAKNEKGPGSDAPSDATAEPTGPTTMEFPHYQNFVDAIRANDPKLLTCDIMEGHLSSTLPHLANIAYRVGHTIQFDGTSESIKDDRKANDLLTREYRKGFEIPSSFPGKTSVAR
jgi:GFO/IDH/MocA oxidoreductase family protein